MNFNGVRRFFMRKSGHASHDEGRAVSRVQREGNVCRLILADGKEIYRCFAVIALNDERKTEFLRQAVFHADESRALPAAVVRLEIRFVADFGDRKVVEEKAFPVHRRVGHILKTEINFLPRVRG